jgi:5-hydroxyisourate hydrolase-like protein (transthyretin family)
MSPTTTAKRTTTVALAMLATTALGLWISGTARAEGIGPEAVPAADIATANGRPASVTAVLAPIAHGRFQRSYQHSALQLESRLTTATGMPIADATVEILAQNDGTGQTETIGHAVTAPNGRLVAHIPAGPSRTIDVAYRAYADAPAYAAQTETTETVSAGLHLTITPGQTRPTGTITLHGHVLGQIPHTGVVVEVLVYYHGCWEPIRTPRTDSNGHFTLRYQFQRAYGRFPFALRIRYGQIGFPYSGGWSRRVDVVT